MSDTFFLKEGDTSPAIQYTLSPTVDLTGATVTFTMTDRATGVKAVDAASATVVSPATSGIVQYDWIAADTDTQGFYNAEFEVTYADTTIETFPNSGYIQVVIDADL